MKCPRCGKTNRIYKNGKRPTWGYGKRKLVQYYVCDNCGKQFPSK